MSFENTASLSQDKIVEAFNPQIFGSTIDQRRRASIPTSKACGIKLVLAGKVIESGSDNFRTTIRSSSYDEKTD